MSSNNGYKPNLKVHLPPQEFPEQEFRAAMREAARNAAGILGKVTPNHPSAICVIARNAGDTEPRIFIDGNLDDEGLGALATMAAQRLGPSKN